MAKKIRGCLLEAYAIHTVNLFAGSYAKYSLLVILSVAISVYTEVVVLYISVYREDHKCCFFYIINKGITLTAQMHASIKSCILPQNPIKFQQKKKKAADVCIVENRKIWRAAIFRL